jgi:hypothetical protein
VRWQSGLEFLLNETPMPLEDVRRQLVSGVGQHSETRTLLQQASSHPMLGCATASKLSPVCSLYFCVQIDVMLSAAGHFMAQLVSRAAGDGYGRG